MIKKSKNISLSLFFIFLLLGVFTVKEQSNLLNISFRVISILSLISYYVLAVKNRNFYFVLALTTFLISDVFFSINSSHLLGSIAILLSRCFLIMIIKPDCKKGDKKLLFSIIVLMFLLGTVLLQFYYQDTMFFYISIFVCLALTVLIALTFSILLQSQKKNEYSAMFLGLILFVVSDSIFGIQKISERETDIMLSDSFTILLYFVGYLFVSITMIRKAGKKEKLNNDK